ncbi:MAG: hypothetical protein U0074_01085 [Kouleothrix sp.]
MRCHLPAVPIEEWEKLFGWLNRGYDVAIGPREAGRAPLGEPWHRHLMGRVFNFRICSRGALAGLMDTQGFEGIAWRGCARPYLERARMVNTPCRCRRSRNCLRC